MNATLQGQEIHPDDEAVEHFAVEMKAKLAAARAKGRGGWEDKAQVSAEALSEMLLAHVFKGDPRDVANFAMFIHERGERIKLIGTPRDPAGAAGNISWRADGEANVYFLMRNGNWLANIRMNGEMRVATQTELMHRIATALGQPTDHGSPAEAALRKVSSVIQRYQAPAGISKYDAITEIIGVIESVPLLDADGAPSPVERPADLEKLRERLLAPREIVRDAQGWLTHPALPACDEGVRYDDLLAVFGVQAGFVSLEAQDSELAERYFEAGDADCAFWTPAPPDGDGWMLLEIYDTEDGPYALFGRPLPPEAWPRRGGRPFDFRAHLERQAKFSRHTFGPGRRTQGVADHIRKELREIEAAPDDLEEWIDVVILALDGAWRTGASPDQIIAALAAKQAKNESRSWPDWRTADPDKAIEHTKEPCA